ncbi:MAG TPA: hypothetical protein VMM55_14440 [Thermohalobaculum sp.]|nr:hypothetical protein [Thermohalobaculum sp.]
MRTRRALHGWPIYGVGTGDAGATDIAAGRVGLVGHVPPDALDRIVIAFPKSGQEPPPSLRRLARSVPFFSIRVNWPTFREHFDIDS